MWIDRMNDYSLQAAPTADAQKVADAGDTHDMEHVPLIEGIVDNDQDINNDVEDAVAMNIIEEPGDEEVTGGRGRKKPIRMLNEDGTIYEMENNIVLPEGWGSDEE